MDHFQEQRCGPKKSTSKEKCHSVARDFNIKINHFIPIIFIEMEKIKNE